VRAVDAALASQLELPLDARRREELAPGAEDGPFGGDAGAP
jgi:hypothetical protein